MKANVSMRLLIGLGLLAGLLMWFMAGPVSAGFPLPPLPPPPHNVLPFPPLPPFPPLLVPFGPAPHPGRVWVPGHWKGKKWVKPHWAKPKKYKYKYKYK